MSNPAHSNACRWPGFSAVVLALAVACFIGSSGCGDARTPAQSDHAQNKSNDEANHGHPHDEGHDNDHDDHAHDDSKHDDHEGHDHASHDSHEGHDPASALELSEVAWKNIGLRIGVIEPQDFVKTVAMPAIVVERPGRSRIEVPAPLTGIVTRVYPLEGKVLEPGEPLFDLRLTHEDLVTSQRDFLRMAQEIDVAKLEIERLKSVGEGVVAGRRVLEKKYEQQKIEAALHAQRQGLLLHGLTEEQIDKILETRMLLHSLTVVVPPFSTDEAESSTNRLMHMQEILVSRGEQVDAGTLLGVIADHSTLYIAGQAFEDDSQRLMRAIDHRWSIDVSPVAENAEQEATQQLEILYVADHVDPRTRALEFYMVLPNKLVRDEDRFGQRFVAWQFRPGQRMEIKMPIDNPWRNQIVLPREAVVEEGAEAFVFEKNGDHFDRLAVHVIYRDNDAIVIENDGKLTGKTVAMSGAYQMYLALKNMAGGGVDPHAGHNH